MCTLGVNFFPFGKARANFRHYETGDMNTYSHRCGSYSFVRSAVEFRIPLS
jgi:hypothetical protein